MRQRPTLRDGPTRPAAVSTIRGKSRIFRSPKPGQNIAACTFTRTTWSFPTRWAHARCWSRRGLIPIARRARSCAPSNLGRAIRRSSCWWRMKPERWTFAPDQSFASVGQRRGRRGRCSCRIEVGAERGSSAPQPSRPRQEIRFKVVIGPARPGEAAAFPSETEHTVVDVDQYTHGNTPRYPQTIETVGKLGKRRRPICRRYPHASRQQPLARAGCGSADLISFPTANTPPSAPGAATSGSSPASMTSSITSPGSASPPACFSRWG